jgi:hypothetical protein
VLQAGTHQQRQTQKCLNSGIGVQTLFEHTCLNMFEHIAHLCGQPQLHTFTLITQPTSPDHHTNAHLTAQRCRGSEGEAAGIKSSATSSNRTKMVGPDSLYVDLCRGHNPYIGQSGRHSLFDFNWAVIGERRKKEHTTSSQFYSTQFRDLSIAFDQWSREVKRMGER